MYGTVLGILPQNPQCLFVKDTVEKDLQEMSKDEERLRDVIAKTEIGHLLNSHLMICPAGSSSGRRWLRYCF